MGSVKYSEGQRVRIQQQFSHPGFSYISRNNDVAVVRLATPLNFSSTIGAVALPEVGEGFLVDSNPVVSGFGGFGLCGLSDQLKSTDFSVVDFSVCSALINIEAQNGSLVCGQLGSCIVRKSFICTFEILAMWFFRRMLGLLWLTMENLSQFWRSAKVLISSAFSQK